MVKFAAFNVENLFSRPKAMNLSNHDLGTEKLDLIAKLQTELAKDTYDDDVIVELANAARGYFSINKKVGRNPLTWDDKKKTYRVRVSGKDDWDGFIDLKRARFDFDTVRNTGRFLRGLDADIIALCEVEGSTALRQFRTDQLSNEKLRHDLVIDGNDRRGIDVGILSREPLGRLRTNMRMKRPANARSNLFSRDCLEVEFELASGKKLTVLQNHLLSKLRPTNDKRRKLQAEGVAWILNERYDLSKDLVIVSGDLNDDIDNPPLAPLKAVDGLVNVLDEVGIAKEDQWTYYYGREKAKNRIDFVLISEALREHVTAAGVDRRGIAELSKITGGAEQSLSGITSWRNAASDHAAVWAEFDL